MKQTLLFITALLMAQPMAVTAKQAVVDGIKYTLDETRKTAEAAGLADSSVKHLVIPASIKVEEKTYQVQSIGYMAFHMSHIKSLSLPEGLKSIGKGAFAIIYEIEEITIPNSVEKISAGAFDGCIYVTKVVIGEGVKSIGESAFSGMGRLEKMYIYARQVPVTELRTVDMIEETHWNSLKLYVPNELLEDYRQSELPCWCEVRDNNIFALYDPDDEDYWPVVGRDYDGDQTTVTETIHDYSYQEWFHCDFFTDNLAFNILSQEDKTVEVTSLRANVINGEKWIYVADTIRIPEIVEYHDTVYTVRKIGWGAFSGSFVHHVEIPSTVTEIDLKAFNYVWGLQELFIPSSVKSIGSYAFAGEADTGKYCPKRVVIADDARIESWGDHVFALRRGKEVPPIPDYLTTIPIGFFSDNGMTEWPGLSDNVEVIDMEAFSENDFESIVLPQNLKEIGYKAFYKCRKLKSVTIPANVTYLGDKVFASSSTECFLDTLRLLPTTPPECPIIWEVGSRKTTNVVIIVPDGTKELYQNAWNLSLTTIYEESEVTAIKDIRVNGSTGMGYYSLDGRRLSSPQKGINIIRQSDGTTKKILVK